MIEEKIAEHEVNIRVMIIKYMLRHGVMINTPYALSKEILSLQVGSPERMDRPYRTGQGGRTG